MRYRAGDATDITCGKQRRHMKADVKMYDSRRQIRRQTPRRCKLVRFQRLRHRHTRGTARLAWRHRTGARRTVTSEDDAIDDTAGSSSWSNRRQTMSHQRYKTTISDVGKVYTLYHFIHFLFTTAAETQHQCWSVKANTWNIIDSMLENVGKYDAV